MPKYSHAFTIAFELESDDPEANDVTAEMFKAALLARIARLDASNEWLEACGAPFDTYEI